MSWRLARVRQELVYSRSMILIGRNLPEFSRGVSQSEIIQNILTIAIACERDRNKGPALPSALYVCPALEFCLYPKQQFDPPA
jgi:hypothetical protein